MAVAKIVELKSSSKVSFDDAIKSGLKKAGETIANLQGAWVSEQEVKVDEAGNVTDYRVLLKVTFLVK